MTNAGFQKDSYAPDQDRIRGANWTRFWKSGALHAVENGKDADSLNPLIQFWQAEVIQLGSSARVLDIGTGNGAIPRLLVQQLGELAPACDAVDLSDISPVWWANDPLAPEHNKIRFHGNTQAEELPFENGCFSHVYSQYGLEYTHLKKSVPELLRVLQPAGRVRLIVHHQDSVLLQVAKEESQHIEWLLAEDGLWAAAQAILEPVHRSQTPEGIAQLRADPAANSAKTRFNQAQDVVSQRLAGAAFPDVLQESRDYVTRAIMLAQRKELAAGHQLLKQWRTELQDNQMRLDEIQSHAMNTAGIQELCAQLAAGGGRTNVTTLHRDTSVLAWVVGLDR